MYASHVFTNGQVLTVDGDNRLAEAVAVYDDKIVFVGSNSDAKAFIGPETEVIDAKGNTVMPGFIDAHLHMDLLGICLACPSLSGARSVAEIQAIVAGEAKKRPKGSLVRAFLYDHNRMAEGRPPTRWELDEVAPDHPVFIVHTSFHMSVVNTKALELLGITKNTPSPAGGEYVKNADGELTGLAFENAHWGILDAFFFSEKELEDIMHAADVYMLERGITSVHSPLFNVKVLKVLTDMDVQGKLINRVYAMPFPNGNVDFMERFLNIGLHTGLGSNRFKLGTFKLMVDGSSMGGTAAMREPYCDDPNRKGFLTMDVDRLAAYFLRAHRDGYQLGVHAIGDKAIDMVLDALEKVFAQEPANGARPRIEHCTFVDEQTAKRCKALNVIPVPQPEYMDNFGDAYIKIYGDRAKYAFPSKRFLDAGVVVAFSSDGPVSRMEPMWQLYCGCVRKTKTGQDMGKDQEVTLPEAIRMNTYNGAYASHEEHIKGSLEVGKLADIIVLSKPILSRSLEELTETKVSLTMVDGKVVYKE